MTEHALVHDDGTVRLFGSDGTVDPSVQTKPGWKWIVVERVRVSFDPATQVQTGSTQRVVDGKLEISPIIRDKTQAELDKEAEDFASSIEGRILALDNRVKALESTRTR